MSIGWCPVAVGIKVDPLMGGRRKRKEEEKGGDAELAF